MLDVRHAEGGRIPRAGHKHPPRRGIRRGALEGGVEKTLCARIGEQGMIYLPLVTDALHSLSAN